MNRRKRRQPGREGRHSAVRNKVSDTPTLPGDKVTNMVTLPQETVEREGRHSAVQLKQRGHPARGVSVSISEPTIVFVTVCTKGREPWLLKPGVRDGLESVWKKADAWRIGYYLLMPDHMHFLCSPAGLDCSLQRWISHWKRKFSCMHIEEAGRWQRDFWDTRLRRQERYSEKWEYVQQNPVRQGLVSDAGAWPYQGVLNELRW